MLRRRRLLTATARTGLAAAALALGLPHTAQAQPAYTVSAEQLHDMLAQKFPRTVPLAGLLDLTLQAPRLRLLPAVNRLGATMDVEAAGPALRRSHPGSFDVEFALRYEASDRTLRAHQLRLGRLELAGLKPSATELPRWPSSRCAKWCCTSCARKTPHCSTAWAWSPAPLPSLIKA